MSDLFGCIGCLVKRKLAAGNENQDLAVHYVVVDEYDPDCNAYRVHNVSNRSEMLSVPVEDIQFEMAPEFNSRISNPSEYTIVDHLDMQNIPSGSVIDFSHCSEPFIRGGKLFVRGSYKFYGVYPELYPETLIVGCVYVGAQNDGDIIEFVDIVFDLEEGSQNVFCLGGTVTFQNCRFQGKQGLKVGSGNAPVSAYLVSCTFAGGGDCSVVIEANAQVTMINTTMRGSKIGVSVKDGGTYTAHNCDINEFAFGVVMSGERSTAYLAHCELQWTHICSLLVNGGKVTVLKCNISYCEGSGIVLDGKGPVQAELNERSMLGNDCGLKITGEVD